jgi:hypothetical protein
MCRQFFAKYSVIPAKAGIQKIHFLFVSPLSRACRKQQNNAFAVFVIPVPDQVRDDGLGIHGFFKVKGYWMPDQVRHDMRKNHFFCDYDTVCFASMTQKKPSTPQINRGIVP